MNRIIGNVCLCVFSLNTSKQELRIKWSIVVPKHIWKVESTHRCYSFATGIYWAVTCILDLHFFHMHTNYRSYALHIYWGEELWRANSSCINTSTWWLELTITLHLLKRQLPATCICVWVRYQRYKTCISSERYCANNQAICVELTMSCCYSRRNLLLCLYLTFPCTGLLLMLGCISLGITCLEATLLLNFT